MSNIVIIEKNEFAREALERVLDEKELSAHCRVEDSVNKCGDGVCLLIDNSLAAASLDSDIKESDQFEKPLRIGALLDRIYKHIAAQKGSDVESILVIGPYELDVQNNLLIETQTKEEIRLTDKETHILVFLSEQEGVFAQRQALLDEVWGYAESVETHTLETHIYRLRQKIEKDPAAPELLVTTEQGYVLKR